MTRKKILILGAGLAGLSAAWHLQKRGGDCQIFEKESEFGGLCRSKNIKGFTFDYDGHLLHFKHRYAFNFISSILKNNLAEHRRNAWIYSFGTYVRYPFQANLYGLPASVVKECLLGFIGASRNGKPRKRKPPNFLNWINHSLGKGIARHFMIPYNTKFWTRKPQQLTCDWLDGFIPVPSLNQLLEGTIEESQRQFGYNARFWYPRRGGINQLPLALAKQINNVHTDCPVKEIDLVRKRIRFASGQREPFDYLISTIPLPELSHLIKGLSEQAHSLFKKLRWNSIFNLNLGISGKLENPWHWVYFPEKEYSFFRVGFHSNFSSQLAPANKSSLYAEVAYSENKPIDKSNIIARIKQDLKRTGVLIQPERICAEDINDIKYGYPIYDKNYQHSREGIVKFLAQNSIIPCGRYGSWRYMSMGDVILDGKQVAESLIKIV
ncbi:protoporphyrinogen/coproporphyrinogen oxidase [Candidatus Omnitrophota bacterium]